MNGDGLDDLLIGGTGSSEGGVRRGAAYLVLGPVSGGTRDLSLAADAKFVGEDDYDWAGSSVSGAGDVDGDGNVDVIAGSGFGGGPAVRVFSGVNGQLIQSYFAYASTLRDGVRVASGDVDGDGFADVITGPGTGGASNVRVFDGRTKAMTMSFFAFDPQVFTGTDVAVVDADEDGRADIVAAAGITLPPEVKVYSGLAGDVLADFLAYDAEFTGGVFVG